MTQNDIDILDLRLLRLFDAIHASGSVTKAADALDLSQPTVSIGLARLRRHFGDPLFVRTPEGMLATPLADSLIGAVRDALQALRQVSEWRNAFDAASSSRSFVIAMTDASHITLLPKLFSAAWKSAPSVRIDVTRIDESLPSALQSGDIDLALGFVPSLETGFYQQQLYEQDWICLTRQGHDQMANGLSLRTYQAAGHIGVIYGTGHLLLEKALAAQRIERRVALRLPGFLGLPSILAGSDLIATLPRQIGTTLAGLGDLAVHECPFAIESFFVKQHWHARYHKDPASRWLRSLCAQSFVR